MFVSTPRNHSRSGYLLVMNYLFCLFDEINDVYQYMPEWFKYPHRSLDEEGTHAYGSYIFFEYIEQNMGGIETLRKIFENSVKEAEKRKHEYVTIEHLLLALIKNKDIGTILHDFKINVPALIRDI